MSKTQASNEVQYKISIKYLNILLRNGIITLDEYKKIDDLNRQTFTPELSQVYVR